MGAQLACQRMGQEVLLACVCLNTTICADGYCPNAEANA